MIKYKKNRILIKSKLEMGLQKLYNRNKKMNIIIFYSKIKLKYSFTIKMTFLNLLCFNSVYCNYLLLFFIYFKNTALIIRESILLLPYYLRVYELIGDIDARYFACYNFLNY